jgi:hypothetical protein
LSSSKIPCGYKKWVRGLCQKHQHSKTMACVWCSYSRPPEVLCSVFQQKMLEENLRVTREVSAAKPYNPASLSGSMLDIMSLRIPMRQVLCRWVGSCCVTSLELPVSGFSRTVISCKETKPCHNIFKEKEKLLCQMLQEILRGDYCNLPPNS